MSRSNKENEPVLIRTRNAVLDGRLTLLPEMSGVVLIAGVAGTFHHEAFRDLAACFHENSFGTLITDLLMPDEQQVDARTGHYRRDLMMLAQRIGRAVRWLAEERPASDLPKAFFGTGSAATAGLIAASAGLAEFFAIIVAEAQPPSLADVGGLVVQAPTLVLADESFASKRAALVEGGVLAGDHDVVAVDGLAPFFEDHQAYSRVARRSVLWLRSHAPAFAAA